MRLPAVLAVLCLALLAGCGYHAPGAVDRWVGGEARTLYVTLFDNRTSEPYLENFLTDALVGELSRSRLIRLTEDAAAAELQLVGAISAFGSGALAYGAGDRITDYRATMTIAAQLVRPGGEIVWQNTLQRSEDYPATIDKAMQLEGQRVAAQEIAARLAEDLSAGLLNGF